MKRKDFLKTAGLISGGMIFTPKNIFSSYKFNSNGLTSISDTISYYTEKGGTIGVFQNKDALIVIDSQNPTAARNLHAKLIESTSRKIDILFNTHHHGDHTSGNYYLKKFSNKIVASKNCVELQKKFYGDGKKADKQVYADTTFEKEMTFDLGKEKIAAHYYWSAHTGGDAIYHFENSNVVHVGDLVFNKIFPWIDRPAGNTFKGWIKYLDKITELFDKDTKFIFGHGLEVTGTVKDIISKRDYFKALLDFVDSEMKAGRSKEKIISVNTFKGDQGRKQAWDGAVRMSLEAAYEELKT